MNHIWNKIQIIPIILISSLFLASCTQNKKDTCIEENNFMDSASAMINPKGLSVQGGYSHDTSKPSTFGVVQDRSEEDGQTSEWQKTGLIYNGKNMLIKISNRIIPHSAEGHNDIPACKICASPTSESITTECYCPIKKESDIFQINPENCIDHPAIINTPDRKFISNTIFEYQSDSKVSTVDRRVQQPEFQRICSLEMGLNSYISFSKPNGESKAKAYHLFARESKCEARKNGNCISYSYLIEFTKDQLQQIGASAGDTIDLFFYDDYYPDNSGSYQIQFLSGIGGTIDPGLVEQVVDFFEKLVLSERTMDGVDKPSLLQDIYTKIISSSFSSFIRFSLILYVAIFGFSVLAGIAEIKRSEIMNRAIKIALIVMFTSQTSWDAYNTYIVQFFTDGLASLISMVSMSSSGNLLEEAICSGVMESSGTKASRFACPDSMIKSFFSEAVTNKIFGLVFNSIFGIIYIAIIYCLVAFFIFMIFYAAAIYITNILKIIFALSLGPIFICLSLYKTTASMLNKWIAFLVSRSLEILIIFAVLGLFLFIIKEEFNSMLFYRTCFISQAIIPKLLYFTVPKAEIDRSLPEWFFIFIKIGALIYFTYLILKQCQSFATNLAAYGGAESRGSRSDMAGQASGQGSFTMASAIMSNVRKSMFKATASTLKYGAKAAKFTARATMPNLVKGAANTVKKIDKITNAIGNKMPVRGIGTRIIDDAIAQAQQIAAKDKVPPDRLQGFVRQKAKELLINQKMGFNENRPEQKLESSSTKFALLRINDHNISRRLDKILIEDPMKKQISLIAKDMKKDPNFIPGSEARDKIRERAKDWGIKNGIDESDIDKFLNQSSIKGHIRNSSTLSTSQAASRFAHDKEKQEKFLKNLESDRLERKAKHHDARIKGKDILKDYELNPTSIKPNINGRQLKTNLLQPIGSSRKAYGRSYYVSARAKQLKNNALGLYHALRRDVANNPTMARRNFKRKIERKERGLKFRDINPLSHINAADRLTSNLATRIVTNKLEKAKKSNKIALKAFGGRNPKKGTQTKEKKEKVRKEIEQLRQDNLTKNPTTDKDKEKWIKQSSLIHAKLIKGKAQKKNHFEFENDNQDKINKELNSALKKDINYEIKNRDGSIEQERVPIMSKLILIDEETQKANKENKNNTRFAELFTEKYADKIGGEAFNNLLKVKDKESQEKIINDKKFQEALTEATAALKQIEESGTDHFPKDFEQSRRDAFKILLNKQKANPNPNPNSTNQVQGQISDQDDAFSIDGNKSSQIDPNDNKISTTSSINADTTSIDDKQSISSIDKSTSNYNASIVGGSLPTRKTQKDIEEEENNKRINDWLMSNLEYLEYQLSQKQQSLATETDKKKLEEIRKEINDIEKKIVNLNKDQ